MRYRLFSACILSLSMSGLSGASLQDSLPGNGINQYNFLYAGEWQNSALTNQTMYIIKDGKIIWSYVMPQQGEYGDATMLPNGNIVFSRKSGASEITRDKKIVWNYDAPPNSEIHTSQPLGLDKVFIMLKAVPAKAMIINTKTNTVEKELVIPTAGTGTHGMFRHCRYTKEGTFLIAQMDMNKVNDYDTTGKVIWSVDSPSPLAAIRLQNGNTLISGNGNGFVHEVDKKGNIVWEYSRADAPAWLKIYTVKLIDKAVSTLSQLNVIYSEANITRKPEIISSIYPEKLSFDGMRYRTPRPNEAVLLIYSITNELGAIKNRNGYDTSLLSRKVVLPGIELHLH